VTELPFQPISSVEEERGGSVIVAVDEPDSNIDPSMYVFREEVVYATAMWCHV